MNNKKYTSIRIRTETNNRIEQNLKDSKIKRTKIDYIEYLLDIEEKYNKMLLQI